MTPTAPLTALYAPGDRPERFVKAAASGADVVILDLEDAVAPAAKAAAREAVVAWLREHGTAADGPAVQVRVNAGDTPWFAADLAAVVATGAPVGIRLPKVGGAGDLAVCADSGLAVHALLETALGVEQAFAIASHPATASLGLGEADLASDLRTGTDAALDWARSRVVVAARAAGLPAPMMAVYTKLRDDDGLAASCRRGLALGFVGRSAIHPGQLPTIVAAFRPSPAEVAQAQAVVDALATAAVDGAGVAILPDGRMLDAAMLEGARTVLAREATAAAAGARFDR